jgi:hypothetical protein
MSRGYVYLSFFKENKIDYIYRPDVNHIEFACAYCQNIITMSTETSEWECIFCKQSGNILHLIEFINNGGCFTSIYVPQKEKRSIYQLLEHLSKKYPQESKVTTLKKKVKGLVEYYEKTP